MLTRPVATHSRSHLFLRAIVLLGGLTISMASVGLWGALQYSLRGVPASGRVIEFHASGAHSASIVAQVEVTLSGAPPFRSEVNDATHSQEWEVGGTVPLLCTHIWADHVSCVVDSKSDRYLTPLIVLTVGAGMIVWGVKGLRGSPPA